MEKSYEKHREENEKKKKLKIKAGRRYSQGHEWYNLEKLERETERGSEKGELKQSVFAQCMPYPIWLLLTTNTNHEIVLRNVEKLIVYSVPFY